jgi:hypothetical protein
MAQGSPIPSFTERISFLSLPVSVRRYIYILAGLVHFCPIDLNHEGPRKVEYFQMCTEQISRNIDLQLHRTEDAPASISSRDVVAGYCCFYRSKRFEGRATFPGPDGIDCVCGPLPSSLLLVCRTIYFEAMPILYAENQFKICRSGPRGLKALSRLNRTALSVMTSLHIGLNACACIPGHICSIEDRLGDRFLNPCPFCHYSCECGRDLPLSPQDPGMVSLVQEWESIAAHLAAGLTPGRLRLSVVCDTLDYAAAQSIVRPISRLPLLVSCAIRLGQLPNHGLRRLAESTARQVTGLPPLTDTVFRWHDLPTEIQLRILQYSGLLAPRSIRWTEGIGPETPLCCRTCTETLETCCCPNLQSTRRMAIGSVSMFAMAPGPLSGRQEISAAGAPNILQLQYILGRHDRHSSRSGWSGFP